MRVILQVVKHAHLEIEQKEYSSIGRGFLLFVGYSYEDDFAIVKKMMDKVLSLRLFKDENDKTNLSLNDVHGEIMIVSQFTLYADVKKGRRPSFISAAKGEISKKLYEQTIDYVSSIMPCKTGVFGADMDIELINEGPFTLAIDSKDLAL